MKPLVAIVGPTSTGKTSLALKLCQKTDGQIISADSRQIYKYMDIGTGKLPIGYDVKISKHNGYWDINGVSVWGYDLVEPDKYYSSYDFALFARQKAGELLNAGKTVFLVGGTGFYIDAFAGRFDLNNILPDLEVRLQLESKSLLELQQQLTSLNPQAVLKIDMKNKVRLVRAIEKEIGQKNFTTPLPRLDTPITYIGLTSDRQVLYSRADKWVDEVWKNGLTAEVKNLVSLGFSDSPKLKGLVYKTVLAFINGQINEKDAVQRIKFDIHAYIRRQQTWFKKNSEITWFDINAESFDENIYTYIK